MAKEVVLTGLRANAEFHIGNYFGAIMPMVNLQKKHAGRYQINMFMPDLHSFTTPIDHGKLYEQSFQNLKVFVAAGLDTSNPDTYLYRQSYVPAHSELAWILDCFTGFGEMSRMTEFKDKSEKIGSERVTMGLFNYPVLMAADFLLYGARWVPVGEDQRQHLEYTRDIAQRFNSQFGDLFVVPADNTKQLEFFARDEPIRIRSLRNPERKMSKSIDDPAGTIMLSDDPAEAAKKVMSATTDNEAVVGSPTFNKRPGLANLLQILKLLNPAAADDIGNLNYNEFKQLVANHVSIFLSDLQSKLLAVNDSKISQKLTEDEEAMNEVANKTLLKVQKAV